MSMDSTIIFEKLGPGAAPLIKVLGGAKQTFGMNQNYKLATVLDAKSVCAGRKVGLHSPAGKSCTSFVLLTYHQEC
jgi:hypothetical protein